MARKDDYIVPLSEQKVSFQTMEEVMHNSMMPYAEHVILERALPRVEDGLKPVQRRVLYAMYTQNLFPDKPYKKSAYIVGKLWQNIILTEIPAYMKPWCAWLRISACASRWWTGMDASVPLTETERRPQDIRRRALRP